MSKINIRPFKIKDISDFVRLDQECFSKKIQFTQQELVETLSHEDVISYVIEDDKTNVIGTFILKLEKFKNTLILLSITITESFRSCGIGQYTLNFILEIAKHLNVNQISLQIESSNKRGVHFFEKFGFMHEKSLNDFLFKNNQGVEMQYSLVTEIS